MNARARNGLARWLGLGLALLVLNFALSFHNIWPTLWITMWPELSMEAAAVVVLLALWRRLFGRVSNRLLAVTAAVLLLMTLGRYLEVTAPALYGRAVNLYWDARYLPDVASMLAGAVPVYVTVAFGAALAAGLALIYALLRWALGRVRSALDEGFASPYLPLAAAALVAAYFLGYYAHVPTLRWFSIPVSQTYARQAGLVMNALSGTGAAEAALPETSTLDSLSLDAVVPQDVIVTFVESYGATAYDAESVASVLEEPRAHLAAAVAATGRRVMSAFVTVPTTGGGSWLSHSSFMTGLWIDGPARYDSVLTQHRATLPKIFAGRGYRTLALMPGLKNRWPEGSFYGFDEIYGEDALAYTGPEFGWWRIPDQFALAQLDALELARGDRAPVFVFFPTISTHMPFRPTPPYQPDWRTMRGPEPFSAALLGDRLESSPEWTKLRPAYADALAYTYAYWGGYLREHADRDFLLVLLGDHQPPAGVAGEGVRWDVPVHVITRDDGLVARLRRQGFVEGLTPAAEPVTKLDALAPMLFR